MIPKDVYNQISARWDSSKKIYAKYKNIKERLKVLDKELVFFKGSNVLEIGCNAGIAAYSIAEVANSYIGVDVEPHYIDQAMITKEFIPNSGNVGFVLGGIRDIKNFKYDALFMSYSLYHLPDDEIAYLVSDVLPKCKYVIIMNRSKQRHVEKNSHRLWYFKNSIRFIESNGFKVDWHWGNREKSFYIIVGTK